MAAVENSNPHGPLDPARLTAFEARIGAALPAAYRRFLLAHNGGQVVPCEIVLPGEAEPLASLGAAFGLHHGADSLDRVFDNVKAYIPAEVIAFAARSRLVDNRSAARYYRAQRGPRRRRRGWRGGERNCPTGCCP